MIVGVMLSQLGLSWGLKELWLETGGWKYGLNFGIWGEGEMTE